MTYCVGLLLNAGLVLLSDTRTNAGLDNISTYRKMFTFEEPGERVIVMMTAGNLSVTQTTLARLTEEINNPEATHETSIMKAENMLDVATQVGEMLSRVTAETKTRMDRMNQSASASMIVAGQRKGGRMRLFLVYPEGNFIEATEDTPYLQIGEHKYGKPILDRVITADTPLEEARKAVLLSMDSTLRSNLSVGMPLDMVVIEADSLRINEQRRIEANDEEFAAMSAAWSQALRDAFTQIK
ncbi:peptidase [Roseinatronobacter bogoriensis]|uniref:Peptidase n=1 Tax=Roseinatronobacter bogoriensis subsp. barguzinensis TaxID=441209 RepID=A0A2K8KDH7_9RHOB|nr:peptidase [Rhodobaca]ATX65765.1 peptidase [Rhodobaca barguzinensis]MBB4208280.1 putative proteasome-type protease [Rhodobaca bogoriensis DSM 18756]TDW38921.1 putative proteasome-type protease [Rhodobaca barguzinensis]TDY68896.1 putative proteasome-type protease [Rhodobaca bogoriensis DSM 18756]